MPAAPSLTEIAAELVGEQVSLDDLVSSLDDDEWSLPCLVGPWTIWAQIAHLADSERLATLAATDDQAFAEAIEHALENVAEIEAGRPADLV